MEAFLIENWQYVLIFFMIAEKVVKLTPTKYDDIVLDMFLKPIVGKITGKNVKGDSGKS